MTTLERNFILSFVNETNNLNGTEFEYFAKPILSLVISDEVEHKGHNLYGKPVGYTADFMANNYKIIGQCGTESKYFENHEKALKDIRAAISNHPNCEEIYLFSNQRGSGGQISDLNDKITKENFGKVIHVFDVEKIANVILKNITATNKVEEVLRVLPRTNEYISILPYSNSLPSFKSKYYKRQPEYSLNN